MRRTACVIVVCFLMALAGSGFALVGDKRLQADRSQTLIGESKPAAPVVGSATKAGPASISEKFIVNPSLLVSFWPVDSNGIAVVPVCFRTVNAGNEQGWLMDEVEDTWGRYGNIRFTWQNCPTTLGGMVIVEIWNDYSKLSSFTVSSAGFSAAQPTKVNINRNGFEIFGVSFGCDESCFRGEVQKLFGKVLGFNSDGLTPSNIINLQAIYGRRPAGELVGRGGHNLDVPNANPADGARLQIFENNATAAQIWTYDPETLGFSALGKCLDCCSNIGRTASVAMLQPCNPSDPLKSWQRFLFENMSIGALGGKCLDRQTDIGDSLVQLHRCTGHTTELWTYKGGMLRAGHRGALRCLSAAGLDSGGQLRTAPCDTEDLNQKFSLLSTGQIQSRATALCLDIAGASTLDGTPLQLFPCKKASDSSQRGFLLNQQFNFTEENFRNEGSRCLSVAENLVPAKNGQLVALPSGCIPGGQRWDWYFLEPFFIPPSHECAEVLGLVGLPASAAPGTLIALTATGGCVTNPEYRFWVLTATTTATALGDWSASDTLDWDTAGLPAGSYGLYVEARSAGSNGGPEEISAILPITLGCAGVTLAANPPSPAAWGTPIALTATSTCPTAAPEYRFWVFTTGWTMLRDWSPLPTAGWATTGLPAGAYTLYVEVRSGASGDAEASSFLPFTSLGGCKGVQLAVSQASPAAPGTTITLTATPSCPSASPQYRFRVFYQTAWTIVQDWSPSATFVWNTAGLPAGPYSLLVDVRSGVSGSAEAYSQIWPYTLGCTGVQLTATPASPAAVGTPIMLTATPKICATGVTPQYQFRVYRGGYWQVVRPWGTGSTFVWSTAGLPAGAYSLLVEVRSGSSGTSEGSGILPFTLSP